MFDYVYSFGYMQSSYAYQNSLDSIGGFYWVPLALLLICAAGLVYNWHRLQRQCDVGTSGPVDRSYSMRPRETSLCIMSNSAVIAVNFETPVLSSEE